MTLGNGEHIDPIVSDSFAEGRSLAYISQVSITFDFVKHVFEIAIGVWIAIGKVDLIIIILKGILPGKSIERFIISTAFAKPILIIFNILSSSMPTNVLFLALSFGIDDDLHSHFIKIVHFVLIEDVKFTFLIFKNIRNFKKEPLGISIGIYIVLKEQIVFLVRYFGNH